MQQKMKSDPQDDGGVKFQGNSYMQVRFNLEQFREGFLRGDETYRIPAVHDELKGDIHQWEGWGGEVRVKSIIIVFKNLANRIKKN